MLFLFIFIIKIYYDPAPIIVLTVDPPESFISKVTALTNSVDDTVFACKAATPVTLPDPSKLADVHTTSPVIPIVRPVVNAAAVVAVAAFPVVDPELPDTLPVTLPVRFPSILPTNVPVVIDRFPVAEAVAEGFSDFSPLRIKGTFAESSLNEMWRFS